LLEAAAERGYQAEIIHLLKCSITICMDEPDVYYNGTAIRDRFDIIIPRIDTPHTEYGLTILRQFLSMHIFTTENALSLALGRDKLRCTQRMLKKRIPFPTTGFAHSTEDFDNIIQTVGGVPLIIKLVEGTEGVGVFLADDMKHAVNLLKTFQQLSIPLIVQKFVKESAGTDIRAFVVGDEVVASMQRTSQDGDFRANVALGGEVEQIVLTDLEKEIALNAARAIDINVAGVDIIRSGQGPLVIEINVSPGFTGLETVSDNDVAGAVIEHAVKMKLDHDKKKSVLSKTA